MRRTPVCYLIPGGPKGDEQFAAWMRELTPERRAAVLLRIVAKIAAGQIPVTHQAARQRSQTRE